MATEKKKDKRGSRATLLKRNATIAGMTVEQYKKWLDTDRLRRWTKKARQRQIAADAEFGRMARAFLANLGTMLGELANLRSFVMNGAKGDWRAEGDAAMDGRARNGKAKRETAV